MRDRRDDRRAPRQPQARINDGIRAKQVRLISPEGEQVGVVSLQEALRFADERELDLVQVAEGETPVCKVMDYSKHRYEEQRKQKEQRKHAAKHNVKTVRLRPKIAEHDYETKATHARKFLEQGASVQAQVMFRGREMAHPDIGVKLLERLAADCAEHGKVVSAPPKLEGRSMQIILQPLAKKS